MSILAISMPLVVFWFRHLDWSLRWPTRPRRSTTDAAMVKRNFWISHFLDYDFMTIVIIPIYWVVQIVKSIINPYLSIYPSIYPSIHLSINLSIYLSIYLLIYILTNRDSTGGHCWPLPSWHRMRHGMLHRPHWPHGPHRHGMRNAPRLTWQNHRSLIFNSPHKLCWLVVSTPLKNISQWEGLSHILWKIKHVPNHQPVWYK